MKQINRIIVAFGILLVAIVGLVAMPSTAFAQELKTIQPQAISQLILERTRETIGFPNNGFVANPQQPGDGGNQVVIQTCNDSNNNGGCKNFASNCLGDGGTYVGNNNAGTCTS